MCVCRGGHWCPKVSAGVMSVTGSKVLGLSEGGCTICMGILTSRACLCGAVRCWVETVPERWKEDDCMSICLQCNFPPTPHQA